MAVPKDKQVQLIRQLADIIQELDWVIAVPADDEICQGLIVGTPEYVSEVVQSYYGEITEIEMDVFTPATETGDLLPEVDPSKDKKYH